MPIEIIVPRLGWSMEEGAFVAWLKKDGDPVEAGEPLFSIEGDKAVQEIESLDRGILRIAANGPRPGDPIRVGDVLGHLVSAAERAPESGPAGSSTTDAELAPATLSSPAAPASTFPAAKESVSCASNVPIISPRALRVALELDVDWTRVAGTARSG